jgi:hypothetical protein
MRAPPPRTPCYDCVLRNLTLYAKCANGHGSPDKREGCEPLFTRGSSHRALYPLISGRFNAVHFLSRGSENEPMTDSYRMDIVHRF